VGSEIIKLNTKWKHKLPLFTQSMEPEVAHKFEIKALNFLIAIMEKNHLSLFRIFKNLTIISNITGIKDKELNRLRFNALKRYFKSKFKLAKAQ
jgi:hypothetical protein